MRREEENGIERKEGNIGEEEIDGRGEQNGRGEKERTEEEKSIG